MINKFLYTTILLFFINSLINYNNILLSFLTFLLGLFFADLLSGIVHTIFDNEKFLTKELITYNKNLIHPDNIKFSNIFQKICYKFQMHHYGYNDYESEIFSDEFLGLPSKVLFIPCIFFNLLFIKVPYLNLFLNTIIFISVHNQIFHYIAHTNKFKIFQKYKIIISNKDHMIHHIAPHKKNYCIINGWANNFLNYLIKF